MVKQIVASCQQIPPQDEYDHNFRAKNLKAILLLFSFLAEDDSARFRSESRSKEVLILRTDWPHALPAWSQLERS